MYNYHYMRIYIGVNLWCHFRPFLFPCFSNSVKL